MQKKDWRKTAKVRAFDGYKRDMCFVIGSIPSLIGAVCLIITMTIIMGDPCAEVAWFENMLIYNYIAWAHFAINSVCILLIPKTPREIFSGVQHSVFFLKCSNPGESMLATATLMKYKKRCFLITNAHNILSDEEKPYENIECGFMAKDFLREIFHGIEIIKYDNDLDIAILKFKGTKKELSPYIIPLKWKTVRKLKGGDKVYLIGNADGNGVCISPGMISLPLIFDTEYHNSQYYIQTAIGGVKGTSGGALLDKSGRLVGINTWSEIDAHNFYFSIPIDQIIEYIEDKDECFE